MLQHIRSHLHVTFYVTAVLFLHRRRRRSWKTLKTKHQTTLIKASEPQSRLNNLRAIFIFSAMLSAEQRGCAETELRLRDPARQQSSTVLQMWNLITLMTPQYSVRHPTDCGKLLDFEAWRSAGPRPNSWSWETVLIYHHRPGADRGSELVSPRQYETRPNDLLLPGTAVLPLPGRYLQDSKSSTRSSVPLKKTNSI